jgi:hypothetical protein
MNFEGCRLRVKTTVLQKLSEARTIDNNPWLFKDVNFCGKVNISFVSYQPGSSAGR